MRKIRIAQIGTSRYSHGHFIWNTFKKQSDLYEIVGYALPENEREKFPEFMEDFDGYREFTVDEILNDPTIDAVAIETDEIYLTKYATLAAKHKKHIHMEKPGSPDLRTFRKLIDTVKKNNVVFHTGYMYRYNPYIKEIIQKAKSGELGEIISIEAQMNCIHPKEMREWLSCLPGGMMFYLGCHLVDLILQIHGEPKKLIPMNKCSGVDGVSSKDFGMAVFEYKNGVSFAKTSAVEVGGYARRQFVVSGTKGTIELKPFERIPGTDSREMLYTGKTEYTENSWDDNGVFSESPVFDRYGDMMASFAAMVRGETKNPYTPEYELKLFKHLIKACN